MIETEPWGLREQPKFINMAVEIETEAPPHELLRLLKDIEAAIGRQPSVRMGPRVIDLDILMYDDLHLKTPDLEIPHPRIKYRDFVLRPLAEIAPDTIHPVHKKRIRELLDNLKPSTP
ncbi:MAG: 2-amino-4-hydroxy-6-hydroxymethyldihydropteridine diphosphokinase [Deferribacteres bacterium]|nr:2-amino-4-hydroxy-6-hydroxymethyldihydropteridine diphosphokinase [Deferribacteres bacterium]